MKAYINITGHTVQTFFNAACENDIAQKVSRFIKMRVLESNAGQSLWEIRLICSLTTHLGVSGSIIYSCSIFHHGTVNLMGKSDNHTND